MKNSQLKVLLFASDGLSSSSGYLTGGGLRSARLRDLLENIATVDVVEPAHCRNRSSVYGEYEVTTESQLDCISKYNPDIIFFLNINAFCLSEKKLKQSVFMDLHGPIFLESALLSGRSVLSEFSNFYQNAICADAFTTVSLEQKKCLAFAGLLGASRAIADDNIFIVPQIGDITAHENRLMPSIEMERIGYFGSIYPWIKPFDYLFAIANALQKHQQLVIRAGAHRGMPNQKEVDEHLLRISQKPQVDFRGLVPRDILKRELDSVQCVFDLSAPTSERHIAFNSRVAEFIELAIPTFVNDYSAIGQILTSLGHEEFVIESQTDAVSKINQFLCLHEEEKNVKMTRLGKNITAYFDELSDSQRLLHVLTSG